MPLVKQNMLICFSSDKVLLLNVDGVSFSNDHSIVNSPISAGDNTNFL